MGFIAIVGAARSAARRARAGLRDRVAEVRLIDPEGRIAQGKALDILQSAPVDSSARGSPPPRRSKPPSAPTSIVIADSARGDEEHAGEAGPGTLRQARRPWTPPRPCSLRGRISAS